MSTTTATIGSRIPGAEPYKGETGPSRSGSPAAAHRHSDGVQCQVDHSAPVATRTRRP